jgi:hypothetical protein
MDIAALLVNPVGNIGMLVQRVDTYLDLGLNEALLSALPGNATLLANFPFIGSPRDFQLCPPRTFLRLRASFNCPMFIELIPLRFFHASRDSTGLVPHEWGEPLAIAPFSTGLTDRRGVAVSTLAVLTGSARQSPPQSAPSSHFQFSDGDLEPIAEFDGPLEVTVRITIELPDIHRAVYDFFGFFEETSAHGPQLASDDGGFYRMLPSFLRFAAVLVTSHYTPVFAAPPTIADARGHVLEFLRCTLGPVQAELLLLWLVGRVRTSELAGLASALLALNFYRCSPSTAATLFETLSFLCTAVVRPRN